MDCDAADNVTSHKRKPGGQYLAREFSDTQESFNDSTISENVQLSR